jgi:serine/threonine protein phosphatase PrpC
LSRLLTVEAAGRTEVGRRRDRNQDVFIVRQDLGLFLVVDGMGGHPAGEVAAAITAEAVQRFYDDRGCPSPVDAAGPLSSPQRFLSASLKHANAAIRARVESEPEKRGMGAAIAAMHATSSGFCLAHAGHVRGYRLRDRRLQKLTEDHTQLTESVWRGVPLDVAESRPDKHALSRGLGLRESVDATVCMDDARAGDLVLLCSNGLSGVLSDAELCAVLAGKSDVAATADALIALADARRAADDATCVVVRWSLADQLVAA